MIILSLLGIVACVGLLVWVVRANVGWQHKVYVACLVAPTVVALAINILYPARAQGWRPIWLYSFWTMAAAVGVAGLMEYGILRALGLLRLGAIIRVTYYEVMLQPFTLIILGLTLAFIIVGTFVPYYTFNEDNKMYRDIATQFCLLAALAVMVYSAAKVVDEEIENRTMLTLMSKPISRWEVIVGKYLGILCVIFVVLGVLGLATETATFLHWYDDKRLDLGVSANSTDYKTLMTELDKDLLALIPLFVLQFLEVATLAAVAVAISTRYPLALNVTAIVVLYVVANLTVYLPRLNIGEPWRTMATEASYLPPYLANFDLSQRLIYGNFTLGEGEWVQFYNAGLPSYGQIWGYTGVVGVYALLYSGAALALATSLFRTRELT